MKEGNGGGGSGSDSLALGGAQSIVALDTDVEPGSGNASVYRSYSWRLGAFSETTGYPGSVTSWDGRIFWGRTDDRPRAAWYSRANYVETMSPSDVDGTVTDSHGGMVEIAGDRVDEILWLHEAPRLQIGTTSAIRSIGPANNDAVFGPRNASQRLEVRQGASSVRPEPVGPSTVHAGRFSRSLNDLYFDFQANTLVAPPMSAASDHLLKPAVKEITFAQEPDKLLYTLLDDGTFLSTTVERYEKVIGITRHSLAGGTVKSMVAIPGSTRDDVYMIVQRTINGVAVQYVETLDPLFDPDTMVRPDAFLVDCGGTYSGAETATVSGITWLANTQVDILADGHRLPRATVSTIGVLTLPNGRRASKIQFGVPIQAYFRTMRAPSALNDGSGLGRKCRVVSVYADLYGTLGLSVRSDGGVLDRLKPLNGDDPYISDTALMNGTVPVLVDGTWESDGQVTIECTGPLPATVRALNIHLETE